MRFGTAIALAALGTSLPATAFADDNVNFFVQDGNTHHGLVIQTGVGNAAGKADLEVRQTGFDNQLTLTQTGDNNDIGLAGRGLVQTGTAASGAAPANSAEILQQSDGNSIGELVQTNLGARTGTGNLLTVNQLTGGSNTINSIEQIQGDGAAVNRATFTQDGIGNWVNRLAQTSTSGEGDNSITLTTTGNYNGTDAGTNKPSGGLAVLARSAGAVSGEIVQEGDATGGAQNVIALTITGNYNQFGLHQLGVDNSVGETFTGDGNSFGTYQMGRHNQIVAGGIAGDGNDLGIRQVGESNTASVVLNWSSSTNRVGVGQTGDDNAANVALKGDDSIVGVSQNGNGHSATIAAVGNTNVVLAIQYNAGLTASVGSTLTVSIDGDRNNALQGLLPRAFTGAALTALAAAPGLPRALLVAPDASALLSLYDPVTLVPGVLAQWGSDNSIDTKLGTVSRSNDNLFAALQKGTGNTVAATVNGDANQFVVVQVGDYNDAAIEQTGHGNIASISQ